VDAALVLRAERDAEAADPAAAAGLPGGDGGGDPVVGRVVADGLADERERAGGVQGGAGAHDLAGGDELAAEEPGERVAVAGEQAGQLERPDAGVRRHRAEHRQAQRLAAARRGVGHAECDQHAVARRGHALAPVVIGAAAEEAVVAVDDQADAGLDRWHHCGSST
jgi:hypothetical protein